MKTFAIESSCDDTSLALVCEKDGWYYCEKLLTYRQEFHTDFWWVVPELASRAHSKTIIDLFQQFLEELAISKEAFFADIDCISVTNNPGLSGSLMVGKTFAKMLSLEYNKPLYYIDHCYGHVFSLLLDRPKDTIQLPMLVLSASGWHTNLYLICDSTPYQDDSNNCFWPYHIRQLSSTRDDSAGEAYDKVARLLGWPYPGWAWIEQQAALHTITDGKSKYHFKRIMLEADSLDFSFSWMKSQAAQHIQHYYKEQNTRESLFADSFIHELAYEFQEAMTDILCEKIALAVSQYHGTSLWMVWWVSANKRLRKKLEESIALPTLTVQRFVYCTDNAAMIGMVGLLLGKNSF